MSSVNMRELVNQDWKTYPFVVQKICGIRIVITSTNANISATTTYNAVISRHQTEPSLGLTLSKVTRNDRLFTKYNLTVPYAHIQSIRLQKKIPYNTIKVFEEEVPLQRIPILKTAYNQEYVALMFGRDHPNPMLTYDDRLLPFTPNNLIDVSYLQQVYNLEPQTFGYQTWLQHMGVHNFAKSSNVKYSSTQTLDLEEFQCLDSSLQMKLVTAWQDYFLYIV